MEKEKRQISMYEVNTMCKTDMEPKTTNKYDVVTQCMLSILGQGEKFSD